MVAPRRRIGWIAAIAVLAAALVIGGLRDRGPRSNRERADAIAKTIKCPICNGESVFVSRVAVAGSIRDEIARRIGEGRTDDEVRALVERGYPGSQLVPPASGFSSLIWVLPVFAVVVSLFGLASAFRRWRTTAAAPVTDDDRALVAAALAAEHGEVVDGVEPDDGPA